MNILEWSCISLAIYIIITELHAINSKLDSIVFNNSDMKQDILYILKTMK